MYEVYGKVNTTKGMKTCISVRSTCSFQMSFLFTIFHACLAWR